jgi:hypothetical protein
MEAAATRSTKQLSEAVLALDSKIESLGAKEKYYAMEEILLLLGSSSRTPTGSAKELLELFKQIVPNRRGKRGEYYYTVHTFYELLKLGREPETADLSFELMDALKVHAEPVEKVLRIAIEVHEKCGMSLRQAFKDVIKKFKEFDSSGKRGLNGVMTKRVPQKVREAFELPPPKSKGNGGKVRVKRVPASVEPPKDEKVSPFPVEARKALVREIQTSFERYIEGYTETMLNHEARFRMQSSAKNILQEALDYVRVTSVRLLEREKEAQRTGIVASHAEKRSEYEDAYQRLTGALPPTGTLGDLSKVKKLWREVAKLHHPDINSSPESASIFNPHSQAYSIVTTYHETYPNG